MGKYEDLKQDVEDNRSVWTVGLNLIENAVSQLRSDLADMEKKQQKIQRLLADFPPGPPPP